MANVLTAKQDRITFELHNALSNAPSKVERAGFLIRSQQQTLRMTTQRLEHALSNFSGSAPTATDVNADALTHTSQARAGRVTFTREEIQDAVQADGGNSLIDGAVSALANQFRKDHERAFFEGLNGLFGTAHPLQSVLSGNPNYFETNLTLVGVGPGGADVVVNNLLTSPLSESSFYQARQRMMEQTNWSGDPLDIEGPYVLVVSPKNERLAKQLVNPGYMSDQASGAPQGAPNVGGPEAMVLVTTLLSDDDDWFLIYRGLDDKGFGAPVGLWEKTAPIVQVREDSLFITEIEAYSDRGFVYAPDGLGIIASNVA